MKTYRIAELLGDGIAAELSESVHRIAEVLPFGLEFEQVDLSVAARQADETAAYDKAVEAMRRLGSSIKYPTATTETSPNKVLRERCNFHVIHRPVMTIPGIQTNFTRDLDIDVVRVATGGTYEDKGRLIGAETAVSLRVIERGPSMHAGRFAFKLAMMRKTHVVSTSKYTIQKAADGLFESAVEAVSKDYPGIAYRRELFDALLAGVIMHPERYGVIVCPNEYGDFLSDMACGLIGSIGLGDSASYAFADSGVISLAMFDPAGGTAPDIAGKNVCNPFAALFALSSLLRHVGEIDSGKSLRRAVLDCIEAGESTADIGGKLRCDEFTGAVAARFQTMLAGA